MRCELRHCAPAEMLLECLHGYRPLGRYEEVWHGTPWLLIETSRAGRAPAWPRPGAYRACRLAQAPVGTPWADRLQRQAPAAGPASWHPAQRGGAARGTSDRGGA